MGYLILQKEESGPAAPVADKQFHERPGHPSGAGRERGDGSLE
jgi:hypothetical protein